MVNSFNVGDIIFIYWELYYPDEIYHYLTYIDRIVGDVLYTVSLWNDDNYENGGDFVVDITRNDYRITNLTKMTDELVVI